MSERVEDLILSENGSTWFRMDLHLHSPGVESFKLPNGVNISLPETKKRIVKNYVEQLKRQNIKIGAITDYQQIRKQWFKPIQEEAKKEGIYILPGVELSIIENRKIHVLLIFNFNQDVDAVNNYILSLDEDPQKPLLVGDRGHREIQVKGLIDILSLIKGKIPCIIIFPHPSDGSGIVKELKPKEAAKYLKIADGIEYLEDSDKRKLISTGDVVNNFFENFASIEGSDPKSIEEIGTKIRGNKIRTTYIKLSSVSIAALRIALHDPRMRIRLYDKPDLSFDTISYVDITGKFLKNIKINFSPEMTTIIGGRGVGKSALIEALRYALDLPVYSDESFRTEFVNSVVGSGGKIIVNIDRFFGNNRKRYVVERVLGEFPSVYDENYNKLSIEPKEIFGQHALPIIIGQKELYFLSLNTDFQLNLIDELIGREIKKETSEYITLVESLRENASKIMEIERKLEKRDEYENRLKSLETQIKVYEELKVTEKLQRHTDLIEDEKKLTDVKDMVDDFYQRFKEIFNEALESFDSSLNSLKTAKSELKKYLLEDAFSDVNNLKKLIEESGKSIDKAFKSKIENLNRIIFEWSNDKKRFDEDINKTKRELENQNLSPGNYEAIVREKLSLEPVIEKLNNYMEVEKKLFKDRESIKDKIRQVRRSMFKTRSNKIDELNIKLEGRLQIYLEYKGNKNDFSERLKNLIHGSGLNKSIIDTILNSRKSILDGIELSEIITRKKWEYIAKEFGVTPNSAKNFCTWFAAKSRLFELESLFPEDRILIKLKVGDKYKTLGDLSAGQKATALLLLLFAHESRILVLDQPEEDLDNRFIYEDVVKILREMKEKRQIIMVTHNANIPVLGDSELIVVLNATNDYCEIEDRGSIDRNSIRENVKNIMEGGEEAFRKRAEKYGGV
ncbi:MAG: AAA family ATPase [Spirochaetales bacterium]|nr:AAA family ATPase [Spirochaetales bacterium]